ncbi:MAG: hypothetical protein R2939_08050 [Kofleriaceae bacterium]
MAADSAPDASAAPAGQVMGGISKKALAIVAIVTILVWAFAIQTGSTVLLVIVGVLTALVAGVIIWALRLMKKQRGLLNLVQGATGSAEARRDAIAALAEGKDAGSPTKVFARAQLLAADDPKAALALIEPMPLKDFPAAMQDDVALLLTRLYLGFGRTADARKRADTMNLDNPARAEARPIAASLVAEAWARTGKAKEALALLDSITLPKKQEEAEQIAVQMRVARVFAKFASGQRGPAKAELVALSEDDPNNLGRFLMPQFRVHPQLQQLARQVLEAHPGRKKMAPRRRA